MVESESDSIRYCVSHGSLVPKANIRHLQLCSEDEHTE